MRCSFTTYCPSQWKCVFNKISRNLLLHTGPNDKAVSLKILEVRQNKFRQARLCLSEINYILITATWSHFSTVKYTTLRSTMLMCMKRVCNGVGNDDSLLFALLRCPCNKLQVYEFCTQQQHVRSPLCSLDPTQNGAQETVSSTDVHNDKPNTIGLTNIYHIIY